MFVGVFFYRGEERIGFFVVVVVKVNVVVGGGGGHQLFVENFIMTIEKGNPNYYSIFN